MGTKAPARRVQPTVNDPIVIELISDGFEARDISATGAGIYVPPHLEGCNLKSPVNLIVKLPDSEPFRARGRIVHRTKLGREFLGVQFMNLTQAHVAVISRYVERRLSHSRPRAAAPAPARIELELDTVVTPPRPRAARSSA